MQHIGADSKQMFNILEQTVGICATYWSRQKADMQNIGADNRQMFNILEQTVGRCAT